MRQHEIHQHLNPSGDGGDRARPARRWIYLDVLRAVAIVLVLGAHTPFRLPREAVGYSIFSTWKHIGWVGVDLFFVLSGFLIGGLLFSEYCKHGSIRFGRFWIRRALKIWPAYLVFLLATFVWDVAERTGSPAERLGHSLRAVWPYLMHMQNYYSPLVERIGHAWSLGVEEHFYLLLPLVLMGLMAASARRGRDEPQRQPFGAIPWVCLGLLGLCLGLRLWGWQRDRVFDEFSHHWPTHLRVDSLFVGVALAYAVHFARDWVESLRRWRWVIGLISVACFVPFIEAPYDAAVTYTFGYTVLAIGSAGLVLVAWFASETGDSTERSKRGVRARLLALVARVGTYSYSIYLWHMPFTVPILLRLRGRVGLWESRAHYSIMMAIYVMLAITLGAIMYHLVEARALVWRDRLFPSRSGELQAPEPTAEVEPDFDPATEPEGGLQPAM